MDQSNKLSQDLRITTRLSQSQLRFVRLLELNAPEMDDAVARELEENPALEVENNSDASLDTNLTEEGEKFTETSEDIQRADYATPDDMPYYRLEARNHSADDPAYDSTPADDSESIYDTLNRQIEEMKLPDDVRITALFIIGNLDSNGYLSRLLPQLVDDMAFTQDFDVSLETARQALEIVRSLDPAGIGASDLRDCLLMQLMRLPASQQRDDALVMIDRYFEAFAMKHFHRIKSGMKIDKTRFDNALELILSLNPKPGSLLGSGNAYKAQPVIPDFNIDIDEGEISISLGNRIPELRVSESFESATREMERTARERKKKKGSEFIRSRTNDAHEFIRIVRQRQQTLLNVMTAIVSVQKEYLLTEDITKLRPMVIRDIERLTGYDASVISRATNNKFAQLPWGIYPLRFFFSDAHGDEGEGYTNKEILHQIAQIVKEEDKSHPLSDDMLQREMAARGYNLSRRTIAKYRDKQGIPVARLRRR